MRCIHLFRDGVRAFDLQQGYAAILQRNLWDGAQRGLLRAAGGESYPAAGHN